jgi:16S rRNA (cytidine1402-2'-O)-methyltransferase
MGSLYVIGTPIGNLDDITIRALKILNDVDIIIAEDTRTAKKLLNKYDINKPLISFHKESSENKLNKIISGLNTYTYALISEAGTPVVSDPGMDLIYHAGELGFPIVVIPGASSVTGAMSISGMNGDRFFFLGFLPRRSKERLLDLNGIKNVKETLVFFESPHRLLRSLMDMKTILGDRRIAVCREMTKIHEEVFRGPISQAILYFEKPRGEFCLVVEGNLHSEINTVEDPQWIMQELRLLKGLGKSGRDSVRIVSDISGINKRELYKIWIQI